MIMGLGKGGWSCWSWRTCNTYKWPSFSRSQPHPISIRFSHNSGAHLSFHLLELHLKYRKWPRSKYSKIHKGWPLSRLCIVMDCQVLAAGFIVKYWAEFSDLCYWPNFILPNSYRPWAMEPGELPENSDYSPDFILFTPMSFYSYSSQITNLEPFKHLTKVRGPALTALWRWHRKQGKWLCGWGRECISHQHVNCRRLRPACPWLKHYSWQAGAGKWSWLIDN